MNEHTYIFALDIGTRSVAGLILEQINDKFRVVDIVIKEHDERAMLDGQIHDIPAVSRVISIVKEQLEKRNGPLKKVCVAAAGRALKTQTSYSTQEIKGKPLFTEEDIFLLELAAVQKAQLELLNNQPEETINQYFCVGYSVLRYYLDGHEIGSLLDQKGEVAATEIISTFLPKIVVESLISALQRADLQLEALTLEPIAAINALIPPSMRRLNLALVDIGAGTSDVAITREGTVTAYGMVPVAGDEITEGISDHFLLDFPNAEKVKRELFQKEEATFTDILGFEHTLSKDEIVEKMKPSIEKLAKAITEEIKNQNNQQPPKAVMLVGGGSLTPLLPELIAGYLQLPDNRVAIRGIDAIQQLMDANVLIRGPEFVTPIGIAIAAKQKPIEYVYVKVNDLQVRLFDVKKLTIGDSLLAAGIAINKLVGKPGLALMVEINGKNITIPGGFGEPPKIFKNGQPAQSFETIANGDEIAVQKGKDGQSASGIIRDIIGGELPSHHLIVNGKEMTVQPALLVNGKTATMETELSDRDRVRFQYPNTIKELLLSLKELAEKELSPFILYLNDEKTIIHPFSIQIYKNGAKANFHDNYGSGDKIEWRTGRTPTVKMLAADNNYETEQEIAVTYNGKKVLLKKTLLEFYRNGEKLAYNDLLNNGDHLQLMLKRKEPFIFQDIFRFVDIEKPQGAGTFNLKKNGTKASFYDLIEHGDALDIHWEKKIYS